MRTNLIFCIIFGYVLLLLLLCIQLHLIYKNPERYNQIPGYERYRRSRYFWPHTISYERFEFYEQAKKCYAVVATGESAIYANIILQKGVI